MPTYETVRKMQSALVAEDLATAQQLAESDPKLVEPNGGPYNPLSECIFMKKDKSALWLMQFAQARPDVRLMPNPTFSSTLASHAGARASAEVLREVLGAIDRELAQSPDSVRTATRGIAMISAAGAANLPAVKLLLEEGIDPSTLAGALRDAARHDSQEGIETVRLLRQAGATLNDEQLRHVAGYLFNPDDFRIERERRSTTQGSFTIYYRDELVGTFGDMIKMSQEKDAAGNCFWNGFTDSQILESCRKLYVDGNPLYEHLDPLRFKDPKFMRLVEPVEPAPARRNRLR